MPRQSLEVKTGAKIKRKLFPDEPASPTTLLRGLQRVGLCANIRLDDPAVVSPPMQRSSANAGILSFQSNGASSNGGAVRNASKGAFFSFGRISHPTPPQAAATAIEASNVISLDETNPSEAELAISRPMSLASAGSSFSTATQTTGSMKMGRSETR